MIRFFKNLYAKFSLGRFNFWHKYDSLTDKVVSEFIKQPIIDAKDRKGIYNRTTLTSCAGFKLTFISVNDGLSAGGDGSVTDSDGKQIFEWGKSRPSVYTLYQLDKLVKSQKFKEYNKGFGKVRNINKLIKKL